MYWDTAARSFCPKRHGISGVFAVISAYATLFGLIASTGLRISEALNMRLSDVKSDGVLLIRRGNGGKSRLIPLHSTVKDALNAYLAA
jgi:integrase